MVNGNIELDVLAGKGNSPVKQHSHNEKAFIEARYGSEYSVRVKNKNSYRVLVVCSVDGINVIDGKVADKDGVGYIINANDSIEIKGYRKDLENVGRFKFTKKAKSYTKGVTGSSENAGVIALVAFAEKPKPVPKPEKEYIFVDKPVYIPTYPTYPTYPKRRPYWPDDTYYFSSSNNLGSKDFVRSFGGAKGRSAGGGASASPSVATYANNGYAAGGLVGATNCNDTVCYATADATEIPEFSVGSTWGEQIKDTAVTVEFEKYSSFPMAQMNLYYDLRENLEEIGIDFNKKETIGLPKGFPSAFATPPGNWRG